MAIMPVRYSVWRVVTPLAWMQTDDVSLTRAGGAVIRRAGQCGSRGIGAGYSESAA